MTELRTNRRSTRVGLPALLILGTAAAIAIITIPLPQTGATGPPPTYTLFTRADGSGTITPSAGSYSSGSQLTLTAIPDTGHVFHHWEGHTTGTSNPTTLTMDSNKIVAAYFVDSTYYVLTTSGMFEGWGTASPTFGSFPPGTQVQITAYPSFGYRFNMWSDWSTENRHTITMNSHKNMIASFLPGYTLTTAVWPAGSGSVSPAGGGYDVGTVVPVTATASPGWRFSHWSSGASGSSNPVNVTMNTNRLVQANFVQTWSLSTTVVGQGTVSPAGGTYDTGTQVELTATPATGWRFKEWTGDATGTTTPVTLTMDAHKALCKGLR